MFSQRLCALLLASAATLTACGGGGGGIASIPDPITQPPPPPPGGPLPPAHIGLVSDQPFVALGTQDAYTTDANGGHITPSSGPSSADVQFSYNPATNDYSISLPGFQAGTLANIAYNGTAGHVATSTTSQVSDGSSATLQPLFVMLPVPGSSHSPYTYTSFGTWNGRTGVSQTGDISRSEGIFAYGIPTAQGDVPINGSASYTAQIYATTGPNSYPSVGGDVNLLFNFAAGTLSGSMHPKIDDNFDGIFVDFGQFDFKNTVYSTGSTTFSGQFVVPGLPNADSSFNGNFTGPNAAELMARFQTPFLLNGNQGTISGVWVGKKN